jgi:hypothetical protein
MFADVTSEKCKYIENKKQLNESQRTCWHWICRATVNGQ